MQAARYPDGLFWWLKDCFIGSIGLIGSIGSFIQPI